MVDLINQTPPRIACYGFVEKQAGSVAGANFLILEELLKRGFEIDFYGFRDFVYPQELLKYKNFHYIAVPYKSLARSFMRVLPSRLNQAIWPLAFLLFIYRSDCQAVQQEILANHQARKYTLLLYLGLYAPFKVEGVPTISWPQGPPQTEWYYIHKNRKTLISLCGITVYIKLIVFYAFRDRQARSEVKISNILIYGSQWSKEQLVSYGAKQEIIRVLPYPIDTNLFRLKSSYLNQKRGDKIFLWLGRIVSRKRLDLLLEAYALVLKERRDIQLKIIGTTSYTKGYKKLIDQFEFPNHIEYQSNIDSLQVPELIAQCDILIQPSEGENFGSSVAEALCCGLPVIVGPTNGTKDYISSSSFIFEAYNPQALKETMLQAIQAVEQDQEKLALDARQTAERSFSVSTVVNCLQDIFQEALS